MMKLMAATRDFLLNIDRPDLARLLAPCEYEVVLEEVWFDAVRPQLAIDGPGANLEAIQLLPDDDRRRIIEAVTATDPTSVTAQGPPSVLEVRRRTSDSPGASDDIFALLYTERAELIDVATGRARINDKNDYFRARRRRIKLALAALGIEDPVPFDDLWEWYQEYREQYSHYHERRTYINRLYAPLLSAVLGAEEQHPEPHQPTGWERVDRALAKARDALIAARVEEDFQQVGLLAREVLISVAQAVYDPERHPSSDGVSPSQTDAARMLENFFTVELVLLR